MPSLYSAYQIALRFGDRKPARQAIAAGLVILCVTAPAPLRAQNLNDALDQTLLTNPSVKSDEARQDAAVSRLRGSIDAFMPTVSLVHERILGSKIRYSPDLYVPTLTGADSTSRREPDLLAVQASLSLFDGFRRYNTFRSASIGVEAGKALQIGQRQQVMLDASIAYLSVLRDQAIVELRRRQISATSEIADRTRRRLETRDATQTQLDIASSRVMAAQVALEQADAELNASKIEFTRITGLNAVGLSKPRIPNHVIPKSVGELQAALLGSNPQIAAARLDAKSADYLADAQWGELSPQVNLVGLYGRQSRISDALDHATDTTVKMQLRVPLYEPGAFARIGEASAVARQRSWDAVDVQKKGVAAATSLYLARASTIAQIARSATRVKTIRSAVEGYRIEQTEGYRTIIDSLNAQNELSDAEATQILLEFIRDRQTFTIAAALARLGPTEVASASKIQRISSR